MYVWRMAWLELIYFPLAAISSTERPFTPDGAKDLSGIWQRQSANQHTPQTRKLAKPNALMFFHIPLSVQFMLCDNFPHRAPDGAAGLKRMESQT